MITSGIIPRPLARLPWRLIFLVAGIAGFGLTVLYSAAGGSAQPWALKQGAIFLFFLAVAIGMSWVKESTIKALAFPIYGVTLVMLIGVEALGFVNKGAQRWLDIGPIRLQPSEFMKPAIVLALARFYELVPAGETRKARAIWPAMLLLGVPAFLILIQPDLGTCIMVVLCGITVMPPSTTMVAVPRSGCTRINPAGTPISNAAGQMARHLRVRPTGSNSKNRASTRTIAGFINSLGCRRIKPMSSQRWAPLVTKPSISTRISMTRMTP